MPDVDDVVIPLEDGGSMRGVLARPAVERAEPRPALLVIHDILGLTGDTHRILARLADNGYPALAPDLFDRPGPRLLCVARSVLAVQRGRGEAFAHLEAARRWLAARADVDETRIGVAGFCMGGGFALLLATSGRLAVCAPFYGGVPRDIEKLRGICPVVGGWGGRDLPFAHQGRRLIAYLERLGVPHDVLIYPDAGHAYMNIHEGGLSRLGRYTPIRAQYHQQAAEDSWARMLRFFSTHI